MEQRLLTLEGVCKYYTSKQSVVVGLNNINISFDRGEFVAITGESGSGKSTLAHVLGGILPYESGEMLLNGKPTSHFDGTDYEHYRRNNISFISQNYGILPGTSVLENVVSALRLAGMSKKEAVEKAKEILREVELWELRHRRAAKLSSGQKQRLSIARALAKPAPILIADEPTGNLDPENSAKVIRLLANAAKERLVILITHEFSEAEDYVTRHIVIQDGRVAMDLDLRPALSVTEHRMEKRKQRKLSPQIALLQLRSRPVWTSLVLLFFALTAFAVFAFLGTFIVNLDDTPTRIYDNSAFRNGDQGRIVVGIADGGVFTQSDWNTLTALEYVVSLERYGYVADVQYAWQEGKDFYIDYGRDTQGDAWTETLEVMVKEVVRLYSHAPFIQTIPQLKQDQTFLSAGRLPENLYEVVLSGDESRIGEQITVYLKDFKNWATDDLVTLQATIVGVTQHGSGLFFHEDMGRAFTTKLSGGEDAFLLLPYDGVEDHQFRPSEAVLNRMLGAEIREVQIPLPRTLDSGKVSLRTLELADALWQEYNQQYKAYIAALEDWKFNGKVGEEPTAPVLPSLDHMYHKDPYPHMIQVTQKTFDELAMDTSTQVSITIADYAYTDRVLDAIQALGYLAVSPYQQGSTTQNSAKAEERMQTLTVCILALLAVVALQIIVLRALYSAQTESYHTLSSMGLTCTMAKWSVFWQILLLTVLGQGLGFGLILLCENRGINRIVALMRYLPPVQFAILCGVHLLASVVSAIWIAHTLGKQVYPMSRRETDMEFEEEEAAL